MKNEIPPKAGLVVAAQRICPPSFFVPRLKENLSNNPFIAIENRSIAAQKAISKTGNGELSSESISVN